MQSEDRLLQLQEEVSSGKRLDKLSTNPPDVGQMLRTADADSRKAAAVEINGLLQQVIQAGNAKVDNQSLFTGHKTNVAPFTSTRTYQGDSGTSDVEIDEWPFSRSIP